MKVEDWENDIRTEARKEGFQEGREEGFHQGRQEGFQQGKETSLRHGIQTLFNTLVELGMKPEEAVLKTSEKYQIGVCEVMAAVRKSQMI